MAEILHHLMISIVNSGFPIFIGIPTKKDTPAWQPESLNFVEKQHKLWGATLILRHFLVFFLPLAINYWNHLCTHGGFSCVWGSLWSPERNLAFLFVWSSWKTQDDLVVEFACPLGVSQHV